MELLPYKLENRSDLGGKYYKIDPLLGREDIRPEEQEIIIHALVEDNITIAEKGLNAEKSNYKIKNPITVPVQILSYKGENDSTEINI